MAIRKIGIASRTYRHVNRYRQILTVLMRYGFDDLVDRLKIMMLPLLTLLLLLFPCLYFCGRDELLPAAGPLHRLLD